MNGKFIPLIAIIPLIIAVFTILTSITDGTFVFFQDDIIVEEEDFVYQTYQSGIAYCEEKHGLESMSENMEYFECINTVEKWYEGHNNPGQ